MIIYTNNMLKMIKIVHMFIYVVMVAATFYIFYAGFMKVHNVILYVSLGLLLVEILALLSNGMKCPLTSLTKKYGDSKGYAWDVLLSEKSAKYSFRLYGFVLFAGVLLLLLDYFNLR